MVRTWGHLFMANKRKNTKNTCEPAKFSSPWVYFAITSTPNKMICVNKNDRYINIYNIYIYIYKCIYIYNIYIYINVYIYISFKLGK